MANTSARMLRLLSLLQTHRYWSGDELAGRLDVSPRTLRRDVDRLRELGYPVHASRGVAGGYQLKAGAAVPPLLLDDDEAVAVAVSLRTAAAGSVVAGVEETSVRALTKIIQLMPPKLRRQVDALREYTVPVGFHGPTVDPEALTVIAAACRDSEELGFGYTARDGATTDRRVQPHRLVSLGRRWYLVAWDVQRRDWRSFRVDRMAAPASEGIRFQPREVPGGDAAAFVQSGIAAVPTRYQTEVVVHAPVATVVRTVGQWGIVEPVDEESCRLRMSTDNLDWPAMVLGSVGVPFDVVGPPELTAHLRDIATLFTRCG